MGSDVYVAVERQVKGVKVKVKVKVVDDYASILVVCASAFDAIAASSATQSTGPSLHDGTTSSAAIGHNKLRMTATIAPPRGAIPAPHLRM